MLDEDSSVSAGTIPRAKSAMQSSLNQDLDNVVSLVPMNRSKGLPEFKVADESLLTPQLL